MSVCAWKEKRFKAFEVDVVGIHFVRLEVPWKHRCFCWGMAWGFGTNAPYRIRKPQKCSYFGASFHQFHWCLNMRDRTRKLSCFGKGSIPTPPHGVSMPQVVVKPSYQWSTCCPEQRHPPTQWEPRYLGWCWWIHPGGYMWLPVVD